MLDFAWSEIALIGVVALVLIGPKDMPVAIRTITAMIKKARRMAAEFQTHVDEMVKDTELQDVRNSIREIRSLDIRGTITRTLDSDGSIRSAMTDPLRTPPPVLPAGALPEGVTPGALSEGVTPVDPLPEHTIAAPEAIHAADAHEAAAAFIPPDPAMLPIGGQADEGFGHHTPPPVQSPAHQPVPQPAHQPVPHVSPAEAAHFPTPTPPRSEPG